MAAKVLSRIQTASRSLGRLRYSATIVLHRNIQYIEDVITECKEEDIRIYLVMPPIYKGLNEILPESQFAEINKAMNKLVTKYDNASWHDYSHDTHFHKEDFIDENHLNADKGAVKFSKILNRVIFEN